MPHIDFLASSVASVEEAFSIAENNLFSPLFFANSFDDSPLRSLIDQGLSDARASVQKRAETSKKRLERYLSEIARTKVLYGDAPENIIGADEVGRGPLAGPVVVCALILPASPLILGLNDSKKLSAHRREELSQLIQQHAIALALEQNTNTQIDEKGIAPALKDTFAGAIARVSREVGEENVSRILLDGRPLHIHAKEEAIVKGDAKVASIAAASIVAKVARDTYMAQVASDFPAYGFEKNKGYGSEEHMEAIKQAGLSPLHRRSFCTKIL